MLKGARVVKDARTGRDAGRVRDARVVGRAPRSKQPHPRSKQPHPRARSIPIDRLLERQPWSELEDLVRRLQDFRDQNVADSAQEPERRQRTATTMDRLRRFTEGLLTWNRNVSNLISQNDEPRILQRHLVESIETASWLGESGAQSWVDLGSGGGLPAIPLAIVGVGRSWTLVESRRTKTLFLRKIIADISLEGVSVILGRGESLVDEGVLTADFDAFTSRATMSLIPTLSVAKQLVKQGGHAFLWKGGRREGELANRSSWSEDWELVETKTVGASEIAVCKFIKIRS